MEAIKIEILNPKALQLIKGMQDLDLIKVKEESATALKAYQKNEVAVCKKRQLRMKYQTLWKK